MPCEGWQKEIPEVKGEMICIVLWILNLFAPGFGTFLSSCLGDKDCISSQIIVGILQWLTGFCIIGWIWSIWWGALIYKKHSK
mmetsp:Transcript_22464/g.24983  ORF Transcript_22464/g.24983 Transcript_22464/m.24983 type:complete len:83 (+) Transcript_22464:36-284(+)